MRRLLGKEVLANSVERLFDLYKSGYTLVYSFSAGKDSGVCLELGIMAARKAGCLPINVVMRDEEIMFPGTFEYAERVANRKEVNFRWLIANQPIVNVYNRQAPYFWTFDPLCSPSQWVREPPKFAEWIQDKHIDAMTTPERFGAKPGELVAVIGIRTQESRLRMMSISQSGGALTKANRHGVRNCKPIYDWSDGDVWLAVKEHGWDYNHAYNVMLRMGVPRARLRISPPTMTEAGVSSLQMAAKAWPVWFERVAARLPGVRTAVHYGKRAITPLRRHYETWEECFWRTCVNEAPQWIAERSQRVHDVITHQHAKHSATPFPEVKPCYSCKGNQGSWKKMAEMMYNGNPFSFKGVEDMLPYVEPDYFRPGSGTWGGGKPTW